MNFIYWILDLFLPEERKMQAIQSRRIDKLIAENKKREKNQIKLLLLGTGESGKSTFIRQMRIIYKNGFPEEERKGYTKVILLNMLSSMKIMIDAMDFLHIYYCSETNFSDVDFIKAADFEAFDASPDKYLLAIKNLWNDSGIQECFMRRREYQLIDSTKYFMNNIDRISKPCYMPTDEDILHMRTKTTGLCEHKFSMRNVEFRIIDVGGQRSERMKWMKCFNDVKAIIFLVAISEYDQVLVESDRQNRLLESRDVFKSIANYDWFNETSIIIFFNKEDLLREKIMYSDLQTYFPDYEGPKQNYEAASKFIQQMFEDVMPERNIYHHFTCATDTEAIKVIFKTVRDVILKEILRGSLL